VANNYLLFSESIGPLTPKEEQWFVDAVEAIEDPPEDSGCPEIVDFQWGIQNHYVNFYSMESGDVEQVCNLVHEFFKAHRPDDRFTMRWAETCSKPRVGQFGGGMAAVTKWGITFLDMHEWEDFEFKRHDMLEEKING